MNSLKLMTTNCNQKDLIQDSLQLEASVLTTTPWLCIIAFVVFAEPMNSPTVPVEVQKLG